MLLEHINDRPFPGLVREVTGMPDLRKADAQATLFAPNQFLALHSDSHVGEGWSVAYVPSRCLEDWRPDAGGYLHFYDEDGDIAVPAAHTVSFVPPFAPVGRYSVTGWFRGR